MENNENFSVSSTGEVAPLAENTEISSMVDEENILPASSELSKKTPKLSSKKFRLIIGGLILLLMFLIFGALTSAVYLLPVTNPLVRQVVSVLPYPVAMVNVEPVSFKNFFVEWDAMQNYLKSQPSAVSLTEGQIKSSIVDAIIERTVVRQLAKNYAIILDQNRVDKMIKEVFSQYESEEAAVQSIQTTFGWDKATFVERIIKPLVLSSQLNEAVANDSFLQTEAKSKINAAAERLKNGDDFAIVAKEMSEDTSASNGGDIGKLSTGVVPAEWVSAIMSLGLNKPSEVIDLTTAYSLVMASEKTGEESNPQYHFHIIIVNKQILDDVLKSFFDSSKIWLFFNSES